MQGWLASRVVLYFGEFFTLGDHDGCLIDQWVTFRQGPIVFEEASWPGSSFAGFSTKRERLCPFRESTR